MSSLNQQLDNDERIIDYLLGSLSAEESEQLDERSFTDDTFAARLQIVENDLLDAYARGELSRERLERFNSIYLTSPKKRELVQFAKTLQAFKSYNSAVQTGEPRTITTTDEKSRPKASLNSTWWRFFTLPRLSLQWGLAAATLVLILIGGYLAIDNARLRNHLSAIDSERQALQKREQELETALASARQADTETASELERVRERLAALERQPLPKDEQPAAPNLPKVATFALAPQLRGASQLVTVRLPAETQMVALQLELEARDFSNYQAALKNLATGEIIWRSGKLKAAGKMVSVRLRADLLKPQNYTLELSGLSTNDTADVVGTYTFKVEKP